MPDLEQLWRWMRERESIRIKKENGDALPWTDDPILRQYRFCNVRREDDRVTQWIEENIRKPFHSHPSLWFMLCISRQINWPPTLEYLIEEMWPNLSSFSPALMGRALQDYQNTGKKTMTGAYMIRAESDRRVPWFSWPKVRYLAEIVCGRLWEEQDGWAKYWRGAGGLVGEHLEPTLELTHRRLMNYRGWGPFMAYQAVVDMRFTALLENAPDKSTWAAAGPGTIRGLNRLRGRPVGASLKQEAVLKEILEMYRATIGPQGPGIPLDLSDIPNCLCEMDKYLRAKNGEGRPRALYVYGRGS